MLRELPIYIASLARLHTPHGVPSCVWRCTFLHFLFGAERWVMHINCLLARLAPFISQSARPHSPCTSAAEQGTPRTSPWRCTRSSLPSRTVTRAPSIVSPCLRGPAGSSKRENAKQANGFGHAPPHCSCYVSEPSVFFVFFMLKEKTLPSLIRLGTIPPST